MQTIMIIEDDGAIREELALLLENEGYRPLPVTDFDSVPAQAAQTRPDLILLDIGLPGRDGFALCAEMRKRICVPVIFVTSRDSGADEVRALALGGDDYITKPYSVPVLLARIQAHVERALFYARAESPEQDCLLRRVCLEKIAAQALENHRSPPGDGKGAAHPVCHLLCPARSAAPADWDSLYFQSGRPSGAGGDGGHEQPHRNYRNLPGNFCGHLRSLYPAGLHQPETGCAAGASVGAHWKPIWYPAS